MVCEKEGIVRHCLAQLRCVEDQTWLTFVHELNKRMTVANVGCEGVGELCLGRFIVGNQADVDQVLMSLAIVLMDLDHRPTLAITRMVVRSPLHLVQIMISSNLLPNSWSP
jgi:hypothetical protein